jgi:hypothetical protein
MDIPLQHTQQSDFDLVDKLEKEILKLYSENDRHNWAWHSHEVKMMLIERQNRLDNSFVWTEDVRKHILLLNEKIFDCEKLLHEEYTAKKKELEEREVANDPFLTDYNLDMRINLCIYTLDEDGDFCEPEEDTIYGFLNDRLRVIAEMIPSMNYRSGDWDDKEQLNWNFLAMRHYTNLFENDFIHYAFYHIHNNINLAWEDILKINCIWSEVNVDYQRITDFF